MNAVPDNKADAIDLIIRIAQRHGLNSREISRALARAGKEASQDTAGAAPRADTLMRLFVYIGGTFVFAGIAGYISMIWDDLPSLPRVIITLGSGLVAYLLGVIFAKDAKMPKGATPAFILAFFLQPTGLFVLLKEYFGGGEPALGALVVFGILTVQQALTFFALKRTALLFFAMVYGLCFLGAGVDYFNIHGAAASLTIGIGYFFLTVDLHGRRDYSILSPLFFVISSAMVIGGLTYYTYQTVYEPAILSAMIGMLALSVLMQSRTLHVMAVLYILSYIFSDLGGSWTIWYWSRELTIIVSGLSVMLAGIWLRRVSANGLTPFWFLIGSSFALGGLFSLVQGTPLEVFYIGIAALGIYAAIALQSRMTLAASVIAMISFIGYYTARYFADVIGWPIALILMGLIMIGISAYAVKLGKRIGKPGAAG